MAEGWGRPIRVPGGLRARSRRGRIGRTWWSQRFIAALEELGIGGRLQRGRTYARGGQVLSMTLTRGVVIALVQGSVPEPYRVRIGIRAFSEAEWRRVEQVLAEQAGYAAKLLAGRMPTDVEDVFAAEGLRLFPADLHQLGMDCTCPDWAFPCKHLAATCYLLAESFDEDPFRIFAWRGRERAELLARLRALRGVAAEPAAPPVPALADRLDSFWTAPGAPAPPPAEDTGDWALDELGPLRSGAHDLTELLRPAYRAMTGR
ncbi:hypothetical protein [Saccharopolyspora cebuensis]|uniref:SWIM-type domain-containing protein n=1 Tax=Saccharopolyspora cebuensis TaxID=418759 RepID=A0ABV4CFJ6_9PSEU